MPVDVFLVKAKVYNVMPVFHAHSVNMVVSDPGDVTCVCFIGSLIGSVLWTAALLFCDTQCVRYQDQCVRLLFPSPYSMWYGRGFPLCM